jgi:hypothetical protein
VLRGFLNDTATKSWTAGTALKVAAGAAVLIATSALAACSGDDAAPATRAPDASPLVDETTPTADPRPRDTVQLDSIAALGHSGLTGTLSDPAATYRDARENSWATGDNPQVQSLYHRLLADHPPLEGHNYNQAVNGATIGSLLSQYDALMSEVDIAPDVIVMQFIDNDIRCDGTDAANAKAFGRTLDAGLALMAGELPNAQFYLTSQWASVEAWTAWAAHHPAHVMNNSGTGPCDVFDSNGRPRPEGIRSMQGIVDTFHEQMQLACAKHPACYTDNGALQTLIPEDDDVTEDLNHLSIAGHRKYAEIAWSALPDEIKQRR